MKVVVARPGRWSTTDSQTYQCLARDGVEVIVATELQSQVVGAKAFTFKHPDEILDLSPDILDCPDMHFALTQYLASHIPPETRLACTSFDNLPGKNFGIPMRHAPRVDLFVARSELIRATLWWDGVPAEKIRIINPGVDADLFEPLTFVPKSPVVLYVGRLTAYKGIKDIIIALKGLRATLWVVGEGDNQGQLQAWADTLGVSIKFWGYIPHGPQLAQIYQEAQVFCSPSYPVDSDDPFSAWMEQFGSSVLEAMSSGLPVITTDTGSFPEFVKDGHNGFTCSARGWYELHCLLRELLSDGALRERMGANGRELMEKGYSSQVIGDQLAKLYQEVVYGDIGR